MPGKKNTKVKKSSTKSVEKPVVETPVVETPVVETPVVETPVVETPVVETPVVENSEEVVTDDGYNQEFLELQSDIKNAMNVLKELLGKVNRLEKRVSRDRKVMNKKMKGRVKRVVDPNKPPSGFAKPGPISDELAKFLGLSKGEEIARTEVTKRITAYCKEHDLQKLEDKRQINPDTALKKLLRLNKNDDLTFFNLQKYMKIHYPKKDVVA